jgi:hypothetical protein
MATKLPRISITPPSELVRDWIDEVAELICQPTATAAGSMLAAMRDLMRLELRRLPLTEDEANCVADVLSGTNITTGPVLGQIVWAEVSEAFHIAGNGASSYGTKHSINQGTLLGKLRDLGPTADLALRLAVARWWAMDEPRDHQQAGLNIVSAWT